MDSVELYHLLQRRPFRPVRVHLADGRFYDIPLRELAVVGTTYLDIGIQALGESPGICATVITVPLTEIRRIEPLAAPATPVSH